MFELIDFFCQIHLYYTLFIKEKFVSHQKQRTLSLVKLINGMWTMVRSTSVYCHMFDFNHVDKAEPIVVYVINIRRCDNGHYILWIGDKLNWVAMAVEP